MRTIPRFAAMLLACAATACTKGAGGAVDAAGSASDATANASDVAANAKDASRGAWVASSLSGMEGPPRIELGETEVRGHTGCNGFSGTYTRTADGTIAFASIVSSKKFCEGEPGQSEQLVLRALAEARRATIEGDTLTLRDASGAMLLAWKRPR